MQRGRENERRCFISHDCCGDASCPAPVLFTDRFRPAISAADERVSSFVYRVSESSYRHLSPRRRSLRFSVNAVIFSSTCCCWLHSPGLVPVYGSTLCLGNSTNFESRSCPNLFFCSAPRSVCVAAAAARSRRRTRSSPKVARHHIRAAEAEQTHTTQAPAL